MLATAAKFVRRDLYQRLLEHAQNMITRGMGGDVEPDIGLLQAILLLVYWKVCSFRFCLASASQF